MPQTSTANAVARMFIMQLSPSHAFRTNIWYENQVAYSYQTPIARLFPAPPGDKPVLFLSGFGYSGTTRKHISAIRDAFLRHTGDMGRVIETIDVATPLSRESLLSIVHHMDDTINVALGTQRRLNTRVGALRYLATLGDDLRCMVSLIGDAEFDTQFPANTETRQKIADKLTLVSAIFGPAAAATSTTATASSQESISPKQFEALLCLQAIAALET